MEAREHEVRTGATGTRLVANMCRNEGAHARQERRGLGTLQAEEGNGMQKVKFLLEYIEAARDSTGGKPLEGGQ